MVMAVEHARGHVRWGQEPCQAGMALHAALPKALCSPSTAGLLAANHMLERSTWAQATFAGAVDVQWACHQPRLPI